MNAYLVYITMPDAQAANALAHSLLDARLIACANILPGMHSVYRWQGKIESAQEVVLILKTMHDKLEVLIPRVEELHPYDTPCVLAVSVEQGGSAYLSWLLEETR